MTYFVRVFDFQAWGCNVLGLGVLKGRHASSSCRLTPVFPRGTGSRGNETYGDDYAVETGALPYSSNTYPAIFKHTITPTARYA